MSLKTKLTWAISLLIAVLLTILTLSAGIYFVDQIKQLVFTQQFAMVSALSEQLDDKLLSLQTELVTTAGTITSGTINDRSTMESFFQRRPDTRAAFDNGLFLFSPRGRLLFETPREQEMMVRDFSGSEFLKTTLATRAPQISEPFVSPQTHHHPVVMFTAPIFDSQGGIMAVLAGSLDLTKSNFLGKVSSTKIGDQGYLYLFTRGKAVVSHPIRDRILKPYDAFGANSLADRALRGYEGTGVRTNARGTRIISAYRKLSTSGWILAIDYPESEALASVQRAHQFLLAALVCVFPISFLAAWILMHYLTAPLLDMTGQIQSLLKAGDGDRKRISVESGDEIATLAGAFNTLLDELEHRREEIHKQLAFSQRVIDTTPIPIFYKDSRGYYLGCNRALEEFLGVDRTQVIGKSLGDLFPDDTAEANRLVDVKLARDGALQVYRSKIPRADGQSRDVIIYKDLFPAADGTVGVIGVIHDVTDLNLAQEALEGQKEFAESLVQNSILPTFVVNGNHEVVIWNHACETLTGYQACEVLGVNDLWKIFHETEHPLLADLIVKGGGRLATAYHAVESIDDQIPDGVQTESWYRDRNGVLHYLVVTAAPIRDRDGKLLGAIQTLEDITARKHAQDAHEKTRRQLQLILDAAGEGIYGVDMKGKVTFVNPAGAQMMGWEPQEMLGKHHHSLGHHTKPDGRSYPQEECPISQALHDGRPHHGEELFWRKDGSSFTVEFISTPIREEGELVGCVVVYRDTTERNLVEEQLLKLSQAVVQSPISIMITDTTGKIEYVNPKFIQTTGFQSSDVLGENPRVLKSDKTAPELYRDLWDTITAGKVWSGDIFNRRKDGETYWEHATIFPIRNSAGIISHYMAFKENMTERKRLEEQLRQAQKMEAIGQLAGGVAHDFNNILTVITGFGQLLHYTLDPEDPKRSHMEQILDAADRATHLTRSLLAFSRKQVMLLQQLELNDLARNHIKFLTRIIGEDISLKTDLTGERLVVMADNGQIEQVLMNLATNARDAMPGGGELTIRTEIVALGKEFQQEHGFGAPGRFALITISDTGTGMDIKTQQKIFEPFFTTKANGRGTGLGLSIVYGIVKQHNGFITMKSQLGGGTTFFVYLPLVPGLEAEAKRASLVMPNGGSETILVVEDDPAVRHLVDSVLTRFGYSVLLAESGEQALDLFERNPNDIDLALLDVIMPKMNGKQVCEELRSRDPQLKVLFLSGYTSDVIEDKGIEMDGIDIIMKPAKPSELAKKIRDLLDAE
ncbi:PAS domain S-box protein [Geomonas sp. Red32]|uniref:PAS domain S-box protein n=1 Tax=Geomonas sp. Red32 TaxID=2912856 RepID=UPI00202CC4B7|nr:PAS domain S-box protein [Geomonas sp. Red32]MCM0081432.1 PAS domain S-box protein [Geomonas sp. Red32]